MDLFDRNTGSPRRTAPLADRMRPQSLEEFVGQTPLLGPEGTLRAMLGQQSLPSLVLWGPPGTGKTTLGRILATATNAEFVALSAVLGGVQSLRDAIAQAREREGMGGRRTLVFIDEIHRFNVAQQDALLPHVESGAITLCGATTENPSFALNAALLSRLKVVRLEPLAESEVRVIVERALADIERGLGAYELGADDEALRALVAAAGGDARVALNTIEIAAGTTRARGATTIDRSAVEQALARRVLLYDKAGEEHYNVVSAFIKSMRGSDPDAAVYWLARMVEAGEDPLFVLRRMLIFAAEDVGLADPQALALTVAADAAFRRVGMPEGILPMTEAALYLALAPKSNSTLRAATAAREAVGEKGALPVPMKLRNAPTRPMKDWGYGAGYQYPHDFEGHYVAERYLPDAIRDRTLYGPGEEPQGTEAAMAARLAALRSAGPTSSR